MCVLLALFGALYLLIFKSFELDYIKSHGFVNSLYTSICQHGITAGYCALCVCEPYFRVNTMANCTHTFTKLTIHRHNIGMLCDFDGGTHIAATALSSVVHACPLCNAIVCSGCYMG